jgi:hypothetical protein
VNIPALCQQAVQLVAHMVEMTQPFLDLVTFRVEQMPGVGTRSLSPTPDLEDAGYLGQSETCILGRAEKMQPADCVVVVQPVAGRGSFRSGKDSLVLVETDGASRHTGSCCQFADAHAVRIGLDLPSRWKEYIHLMDVTLLYFDDCPNWRTTLQDLKEIAGELGFEPQLHRVTSNEEADALQFRGSPTILVNGVDPFATSDAPSGLSCRVYVTSHGLKGSPTTNMLRAALSSQAPH